MNEIIERINNLNFTDVITENILDRNYFYSINTNLLSIQQCTQGFNWTDINRERVRLNRLNNFNGLRNKPQSDAEKVKRSFFYSETNKDLFFQFSKMYRNIPVNVQHFQLRKNLIKIGNEIYYLRNFGIEKLNLLTKKRKMLALFSGDDLTEVGLIVSFDVYKSTDKILIACGKINSKVVVYVSSAEIEMSKPTVRIIISELDSEIANSVKFMDNGEKLIVCCNDSYVKIINITEKLEIENCFKAKSAVNHCSVNNSQNIIALVGDFEEVNLFDYKSKDSISKLKGHSDFGFSSRFKPDTDYILATGGQDYNCKLWDLRKIESNSNSDDSKSESCLLKTLYGNFDSIGDIKFLNEMMIYGENTDYLHVYNLNSDAIQSLEFFGKSIGFDIDLNMRKIYVGIEEENSGVMVFDLLKNNINSLNNLIM